MNEIKISIIAVIIALFAVFVTGYVALVGGSNQSDALGGGTRFPNGISADTTSPSAGQVRGTTLTTTGAAVLGGNLTVTTGANATSTATAGCISSYATSSATQLKLIYNTSATSTSINGATVQGVVLWAFGTCP